MPETFQERFCHHFKVPPARYGEAMLRRTLYRRARLLRWLIGYDFLSADRCFIASVGRLTRRRDFSGEIKEFRYDARNQKFLRRVARLRVSSVRLQDVFREVWPEPAARTANEPINVNGARDHISLMH